MSKLARRWLVVALLFTSGFLTACQHQQTVPREQRMAEAYEAGDYPRAYELASGLRFGGTTEERAYAEYIAGMSSWKQGQHARATGHLERVVSMLYPPSLDERRTDFGEVLVILGVVYAENSQYREAAARFMRGAPYLAGEDQANAYFHAGVSLQKLDRQPEALTQLRLAEAATQDAGLRAEIQRRMSATGFALQFGAFSDRVNAQRLAQDVATRTASMGFGPPRLVTALDQRSGKTVTLVQLGLFTDYRSANLAKTQVGDASAIIVQRNGRVGG